MAPKVTEKGTALKVSKKAASQSHLTPLHAPGKKFEIERCYVANLKIDVEFEGSCSCYVAAV